MSAFAICCRLLTVWLVLHLGMQAVEAATGAKLAGMAFVDSSVTGHGSRAQLPAGAKIYPPGSEITGTTGCPTTPYRTDGLIAAVIDYDGPPTAAALAVIRHPASGGRFENAPYHIDLNWWIFAFTGVLSLFIAAGTVSFQAVRAAIANPVHILRSD